MSTLAQFPCGTKGVRKGVHKGTRKGVRKGFRTGVWKYSWKGFMRLGNTDKRTLFWNSQKITSVFRSPPFSGNGSTQLSLSPIPISENAPHPFLEMAPLSFRSPPSHLWKCAPPISGNGFVCLSPPPFPSPICGNGSAQRSHNHSQNHANSHVGVCTNQLDIFWTARITYWHAHWLRLIHDCHRQAAFPLQFALVRWLAELQCGTGGHPPDCAGWWETRCPWRQTSLPRGYFFLWGWICW